MYPRLMNGIKTLNQHKRCQRAAGIPLVDLVDLRRLAESRNRKLLRILETATTCVNNRAPCANQISFNWISEGLHCKSKSKTLSSRRLVPIEIALDNNAKKGTRGEVGFL